MVVVVVLVLLTLKCSWTQQRSEWGSLQHGPLPKAPRPLSDVLLLLTPISSQKERRRRRSQQLGRKEQREGGREDGGSPEVLSSVFLEAFPCIVCFP